MTLVYYPYDNTMNSMNKKHLFIVKYLLTLCGMWRIKLSTSTVVQMIYNTYSLFIQIYFFGFVISLILELYFVWGNEEKIMENMAIAIIASIIVIKVWICQTNKIISIVEYILQTEHETLNIIDDEVQALYFSRAKYCNTVCFIISLISGICCAALDLATLYVYYQMKKDANSIMVEKPLPYVCWRPFDSQKYYVLAFCFDVFSSIWATAYNIAAQILFLSMMIFVVGQLEILQFKFRTLGKRGVTSDTDDEVIYQKIRHLIREHQKIIKYIGDLNESIKNLLLIEFTVESIHITVMLFQITQLQRDPVVIFTYGLIVLTVFQIFMLSWHANEIKESSSDIAQAVYMCRWCEMDERSKKLLLVVMVRAQRPAALSVGSFFILTNTTALTTIKAAYSYLAILSRN